MNLEKQPKCGRSKGGAALEGRVVPDLEDININREPATAYAPHTYTAITRAWVGLELCDNRVWFCDRRCTSIHDTPRRGRRHPPHRLRPGLRTNFSRQTAPAWPAGFIWGSGVSWPRPWPPGVAGPRASVRRWARRATRTQPSRLLHLSPRPCNYYELTEELPAPLELPVSVSA